MQLGCARIVRDRNGTAAAEMALVTPFLVLLLFGSVELSKYFLDAHTVYKAVRDGARYAARQSFTEMPCGGTATDEAQIKNLVRTGTVDGSGTPRFHYWSNPATITVTITCDTTGTYSAAGIYTAVVGGARKVTVSATIPYQSLFGFILPAVAIDGRSQAAVMGI